MLSRLYHILKSATGLIVILAFALIVILFFSLSQPFQQLQIQTVQQEEGSLPSPTPQKSPSPLSSLTTPLPSLPTAEVVSEPLASGQKIVMVDKGEGDCSWIMWMANTDDLTRVRIITKFQERLCYDPPGGYLSPDGRKMAYILPGKDVDQATLGSMNIDGTDNRILDAPVLGWGTEFNLKWSPDNQWIAYQSLLPQKDKDRIEIQIWLIHPDASEKKLVTSVKDVVGLLGWSLDSSQLYYITEGNLWRVNPKDKEAVIEQIPLEQSIYLARLSPDAQKVLYLTRETVRPPLLALRTVNLSSQAKDTLVKKVNPELFAFKNYQLNPIWSPDSDQVLYNAMVDSQHIEILAVQWNNSKSATKIRNKEEVYYYPISWSPDKKFIFASQRSLNPDPDTPFYPVLVSPDGNTQKIFGVRPDYSPAGFVGWLVDKK